LVLNPSILLLDEPTSGLDPVAAYELRVLIEKVIQKTGTTCIWATHNLHSIPPQARRVVLLRKGRVIFDGETSEGLSRPWLLEAGLAIPQKGDLSC
jgi:ABC-type multidrug transport system ATPase subunit